MTVEVCIGNVERGSLVDQAAMTNLLEEGPFERSTAFSGTAPADTRQMFVATCRPDDSGIATDARCGVISTFGSFQSLSCADKGSTANTSSVGAPICPRHSGEVAVNCCTRALFPALCSSHTGAGHAATAAGYLAA